MKGWEVREGFIPAWVPSKAHREVGEHSPDNSLCGGEGQPLQEGGEGKGEGIKEQHAPLLPEDWQPLTLHASNNTSAKPSPGLSLLSWLQEV